MNTIAAQNDHFRQGIGDGVGWYVTAGVEALGNSFVYDAIDATVNFDAFDGDNDPYGEHDFGSFMVDGRKLFWKIDCYDRRNAGMGSPDPADPKVTRRVLTIMLASEY